MSETDRQTDWERERERERDRYLSRVECWLTASRMSSLSSALSFTESDWSIGNAGIIDNNPPLVTNTDRHTYRQT